ncbi:MAG: threonylcarbamoyl-AMP synthase [Proteobacteria bacterium]|nr:threonylcarbamoyl-AMP synthase [Pseudomonadota bacterium]MBU1449452.1 threonylcarbamoyl-AMP synthase [Pseudomonadota bacterium]MBU2469555.1 threonylcarbamoyl-AMP synthase [Pseudomonadota bacterium]MBU2517066.1 threonylcarbamoyl-AMP synthase [Pseudomonadota bacterium]
MPVLVLDLDPQRPNPAFMARAALELLQGGLVIYPTETLYGIAADYANPLALERLAALKGRELDKPFGLILTRAQEARDLAQDITSAAWELMARHWPGPLTVVLAARPGLHSTLVSQGGVAMRCSPHPVAAGLALALGRAITATSANLAGQPAPDRARDLDPALLDGCQVLLDAGPTPGGPASTVVDARVDPPLVLRAGAVEI